MTETIRDINVTKSQHVEKSHAEQSSFTSSVLQFNAIARSGILPGDEFDPIKAQKECLSGLKALGATGGLQEMLAAQMLTIHQLQQVSIAAAAKSFQIDNKQYFTNTAIKLANTFVQQANLLSRLQGNSGQGISVKQVEVHQGGQAIVGNVSMNPPMEKK